MMSEYSPGDLVVFEGPIDTLYVLTDKPGKNGVLMRSRVSHFTGSLRHYVESNVLGTIASITNERTSLYIMFSNGVAGWYNADVFFEDFADLKKVA